MATRTKAQTVQSNGEAAAPGTTGAPEQVVIERIKPRIIQVEVVGVTPLVVCSWSDKAKRQMLDKQMKKARAAKEAKDPQADFMASRYISTDGWDGVPASGVKGCLVNACRAVDGLPMTLAKRMMFVQSQGQTAAGLGLVRVYGEPEKHEAMVRIDNGGTADIRYRAMFRKWSIKLDIEFLSNVISPEQVLNLLELAGYVEGLCEHRPGSPKSNTGDWGRFRIRREEDN